jgi:Uncharacterized protein conserved in bacteria
MQKFWTLLARGLRLRCPVCGRGRLFRRPFSMYEQCPVCHFHFEREEGYFSSAMAINLVVSELIATAVVLPMAYIPSIPIMTALLIGIPLALFLPMLLFHHCRGIWLSMDHFLNPTNASDLPDHTVLIPRPKGLSGE